MRPDYPEWQPPNVRPRGSIRVARRVAVTDNGRVIEYSNVVGALAALVLALGAATASLTGLPATKASSLTVVTQSAQKVGVPASIARSAFARAPYARNELRTIYAAGFVASRGPANTCARDDALGPPDVATVVATMRAQQPALITRLRKAKIPVTVAASALLRGSLDGCA